MLAHTGGAIHDDRRHIFGDLERGFNGTNPGFVRCRAFGLATLHDLHLDGASADPIDAEVELKDFGYANTPYRAFYGRMNVKHLVELWNDHQEQLVDRNIRRFKGATTVNAGLSETLKTEAEHFFYFNNGVTFLCQTITEQHPRDANRQAGKLRVRGMSIINGAQTVGAIAQEPIKHYEEHPAEVLATFVCLENAPDDFGERVTQSRNRQNAVDLEDFAALDECQSNWQNTLRMAGVTYLVKQGEDDPPRSGTCFSVREIAPYLACAVTTNDWPDYIIAAKTDKKKLGKEKRPKLEPRILLEDPAKSYHAKHRVSENDIFDNRLIFGDNLLALKALEQEFAGKVKCVFIDPPYNTGSAFTHYDDGLEHSIWLGLMRDRLEIIRRLLSEDGSLWITIDDNEAHYLKVLCDEMFGRANFVANVIWEKSFS